MTSQEYARLTREEKRAANRARFPELAAITDKYPHMKLVWAKDADGEIGRDPGDEFPPIGSDRA